MEGGLSSRRTISALLFPLSLLCCFPTPSPSPVLPPPCPKVAAFTGEASELRARVLAEATAWGAANGRIRDGVLATRASSEALSAHEAGLGADLAVRGDSRRTSEALALVAVRRPPELERVCLRALTHKAF